MAADPLNAVLRRLLRAPVYLYRWKCGWLLGHRFLLLIHIGRRTRLHRCTVLEVIEYREEGPEAVVLSGFGRNAEWLRNIETAPGPQVVIGSRCFVAVHRFVDEEEAVKVIAGYERRNRLIAPLVRWTLSRLLGWRYHGSTSDRHRLVRQLPVIAFREARPGEIVPEVSSPLALPHAAIASGAKQSHAGGSQTIGIALPLRCSQRLQGFLFSLQGSATVYVAAAQAFAQARAAFPA